MINRIILNQTSYFGAGAINKIVEEIRSHKFLKALIITDKDLIKFDVVKKVTTILDIENLSYSIFDETVPNPTVEVVKKGVKEFKNSQADYLIAIGGGSPIDTAKAIGIIVNNPEFEDVVSLEGVVSTKNVSIPIFAIPTTSGTAAEVTINYVITDEKNKRKFVCVDPHDIPLIAFIDSEMMLSMPKKLAAATGIDALTHAIEGYITKAAWELTDMFHLKAIEIIYRSLKKSVEGDKDSREEMALGQYIAGMGFSNVGLGLVHGMAHPLGAWYNVPHGVANAVLLPTIMKYNAEYTGEKYRNIGQAMKLPGINEMTIEEAREVVIDSVNELCREVGIPSNLRELGVKEEDIEAIAKDAYKDVCTSGNPRDTNSKEIAELYMKIMEPMEVV